MLSKTALSLLHERMKTPQHIAFGSPSLDINLKGVPMQGITEISGEAGSGKTQLCLSIAVQSVLNRREKSVEYYAAILSCGEGIFPIKRLSQFALAQEATYGVSHRDILSHIDIEQCNNIDQANDTLYKLLPEMCITKPIKLIIIDSLAGLIRFEYNVQDDKEVRERTQYLFSIASQLKWISETYKIAIVVVNQVTADFRFARGNQTIPALGLAWSHCVNTRFIVSKPKTSSSYLDLYENGDTGCGNAQVLEEDKENEHSSSTSLHKRKLSEVFPSQKTNNRGNSEMNAKSQRRILTLDFSSETVSQSAQFEIRMEGLA